MGWLRYATGLTNDELVDKHGLPDRIGTTFPDVTDCDDILAAYALNIVSGGTGGLFNPNGTFLRQDAATMVRNMFETMGMDTADPPDFGFADIADAPPWTRDAINFCAANGFVSGTSIDPPWYHGERVFDRQMSIALFNQLDPDLLP
jgi:hypothetical protein